MKKTYLSIFTFALVLNITGQAIAKQSPTAATAEAVINPKNSMPVCLQPANPNKKDAMAKYKDSDGVLLKWNEKDFYNKQIEAISLEDLPSLRLPALLGAHINCSNWKYLQKGLFNQKWHQLSQDSEVLADPVKTPTILGLQIDARTREALVQLSLGGTQFRSEKSPAEYIQKNKITKYTLDLNRKLTQTYGAHFSGEVLRTMIEKKTQNANLKNEMIKRMKGDAISELVSRFKENSHLKILMSTGLGNDENSAVRDSERGFFNINSLIPELRDMNDIFKKDHPAQNQVLTIAKDPVGGLTANIAEVQAQIEKDLNEGYDLLLIGLSKGSPEMFAAADNVMKQSDDNVTKKSEVSNRKGKILGMINMSGVIEGSFMADFLFPENTKQDKVRDEEIEDFLQSLIDKNVPKLGPKAHQLEATRDLRQEPISKSMTSPLKNLPANMVIVNVAGIVPGIGLASDPMVRKQQEAVRLAFPIVNKSYGANDGYLEYPTMLMPTDRFKKTYTLLTNGSHMVVDGDFGGFKISKVKPPKSEDTEEFKTETSNRHKFLASLITTTLDLIKKASNSK